MNEMSKNIMLTTLEVLRDRIELHAGIDLDKKKELKDQNHLTLSVLSMLDYVYKKLMNKAQDIIKSRQA